MSSLTDEAQCTCWMVNVDAAVFNEGYMSMIDESVDGFSEKVKILYQYGVKTRGKEMRRNVDVTEPFNVFISGIDVDGPITTNSRSDVNLIMTVNPTDETNITDNNTERLLCDDTGSVRRCKRDKLTHAGIYGVDSIHGNTWRTCTELTSATMRRINFTSLVRRS